MTKLHLLAYAAEWLHDRERKGNAKIGDDDDAAAVRESYEAYMQEVSNKIPFVPCSISSSEPPKPYLTCEPSNSGSTVVYTVGYRKRTGVSAFLGEEYLPLSWGAFSSQTWIKNHIIYTVDLRNSKRQKIVHESITDDDHRKVSPVMQSPEQTPRKKKISKKKDKKEKTIITYFGPTPPPDLDRKYRNYIDAMGGTDIHMVIQKPLFDSDRNEELGRLSVPVSKIDDNEIFTERERRDLRTKNGRKWYSLVVPLIDKELKTTNIPVKRWNMEKKNGTMNNPIYALTKPWNSLAAKNRLEPGDIIQLWSFRVESRLHFVLVLVEKKASTRH